MNENLNGDQFGYRGRHSAPGDDGVAVPLHDLTRNLPKDIYETLHHYTDSSVVKGVLLYARGKPKKVIKVHRAVPTGVRSVNPGDWVTIDREYAKEHGQSNLPDGFRIVSKNVLAEDLFSEGDLNEWGWHPKVAK